MKKLDLLYIIQEVLQEENILIPRRVEGRREEWLKKLRQMLQKDTIDDNLDLSDQTEIIDLGNVEVINGWLDIRNSKINSLGKLNVVDIIYISANCSIPIKLMKKYFNKFDIIGYSSDGEVYGYISNNDDLEEFYQNKVTEDRHDRYPDNMRHERYPECNLNEEE